MKRAWIKRASLCLTLLATGCMAIPLSTMWKLRDFSVASFFAEDPAELRVAIQVDRKMKRGPASPLIAIDVKAGATRPVCYAFALDAVDPSAAAELPLERPAADRRWFVFALSPAGIEAFKKARRDTRAKGQGEADLNLNVTMTNVLEPADRNAAFPLRVDVALDRKDGYFTMIGQTMIVPSKPREGTAEPGPPKPSCDVSNESTAPHHV